LPFQLSAAEVITRWSVGMSIASGGTNLLASIAARYLPWLGFTPHQPVHIQAVYLPVWMVDAHVDADVWIQNERQNRLQLMPLTPGFVFEPLSSLSLAHPAYTQFNNVRFSEDLETQHGSDILCLPFTHTPFKLIDLARSLSYEEATTTEPKPLRFDPESVKERLIAAYPLLLPVYIARYELRLLGHQPEEPISYTVVVEAHSKKASGFLPTFFYGLYPWAGFRRSTQSSEYTHTGACRSPGGHSGS
ncbi:hypothetical protein BKA93DRAFT_736922, partial [Sparassis latifolia]